MMKFEKLILRYLDELLRSVILGALGWATMTYVLRLPIQSIISPSFPEQMSFIIMFGIVMPLISMTISAFQQFVEKMPPKPNQT